jgi:hypothetical protein
MLLKTGVREAFDFDAVDSVTGKRGKRNWFVSGGAEWLTIETLLGT